MEDENKDTTSMMTTQELARHLNVTVQTIKNWRKSGKGPAYYTLGPKLIRYKLEDVEEWLGYNI